jgi:hypothetical protein
MTKYYKHSSIILSELCGKSILIIPRHIDEKIKNLFLEIQEPYVKFKPKNRKSSMRYCYYLRKFCELLELDYVLPYIPQLITRSKIIEQDEIWEKICNYLNWEFIPSI